MKDKIDILVVEDNIGSILLIKEVFKHINVETNIVFDRSIEQAVRSIENKVIKVDLVLLDLNFPKGNGWSLLEDCLHKKQNKDFLVLILTTSISVEDKFRATEFDNVIGFYSKPITSRKITEILEIYERERDKVS